VIVNAVVFVGVLFGDGAPDLPETLLGWGATQGSRTASGEWWRLVTASFVHAGSFQLLLALIGIVQVGALLERLVGPVAVAGVYLAAGTLGHAVSMSVDVTSVHTGSSAAIFGLYGLLLASSAWGLLRRKGDVVPLAMYKWIAPGVALFVLSTIASDGLTSEHTVAGWAVGFIIGVAVTVNVGQARPATGLVSLATLPVVVVIAGVSIPIQSDISVRRQLAHLVALEDHTADIYRQGLQRFEKDLRRMDSKVLTELIDRTIMPELTSAASEMAALDHVMPELQPLVDSAREYLRLRKESWRIRAEGLRKRNTRLLQQADSMEQESMRALRPLKNRPATMTSTAPSEAS
jgi:membrane associated rhomboid family serine protease